MLCAAAQIRVIHSQNLHQVITRLTGRVQHTTEAQVPGLHRVHTVLLHQIRAATEEPHQQAAEVTAAEAAAEAAVVVRTLRAARVAVVHIPAVEAVQVLRAAAADPVLQEVVHLLRVADK